MRPRLFISRRARQQAVDAALVSIVGETAVAEIAVDVPPPTRWRLPRPRLALPTPLSLSRFAARRRRSATLLTAVAVALGIGVGVWAYFVSTGTANGSGKVSSLTTPANVSAAAVAPSITVSWDASTLAGGTVAATSYTVERYDGTGTDLGAGCAGSIPSSNGSPNTFGHFQCTDSPGTSGTFKYKITAIFRTWTKQSGFTNSITIASTTTAVSSSANPSVSGQSVTYTATVSSSSGTATGTVNFKDGGTTITGCGSQSLNGSAQATCATSYATPGSHTVTAVYSGDSTHLGSTSPNFTQTVNKAATTTALSSNHNPSVSGQSVTFTATVTVNSPGAGTPTGTVNFTDGGVTITGCGSQAVNGSGQATCTTSYNAAASPRTIAGVYSGDSNFSSSTSANLTQTINKADTTTVVASSVNPSVTGQQVTYTGTVSVTSPGGGTPTGNIEFFDGGTPIAGCGGTSGNPLSGSSATCQVTYNAVGSHTITVKYLGDTNYNASAVSASITQTVNKASTTTSVVSTTGSPSVTGQQVTYTATVAVTAPGGGTPTGNIEFFDGVTPIAGCGGSSGNPLSGSSATCQQTYNASGGSHTITAQYLGDTNYNPSAVSSSITQTVNKADTTTVVVSSANPSVTGQQVTYTATVSVTAPGGGTPTGKIEFLDGVTPIAACGGSSGQALSGLSATCQQTYNANGGSHTITVKYLGDSNYNASPTSASITQTVSKADSTTVVVSSANPSVTGQQVTYTGTVSVTAPGGGTPTGNVEFFDGVTPIAGCGGSSGNPLSGSSATCQVTYNAVGSHTITVKYLGDTNYNASPTSASITQTVNQASTTTAVVSSQNPSVTGQQVTYTGTVSVTAPGGGTPTGNIEFFDGVTPIAGCGGTSGNALSGSSATCQVTYNAVGSHTITVKYLGNTNYSASPTSASITQTINQASTTTVVVSSANPSVTGQQVTYTVTVSVTAPGAGTPSGSVTFKDGGSTITCETGSVSFNGSTATCKVTYATTAGSPHSITAVYNGDTNFSTSTSSALSQVVNAASVTETTLTTFSSTSCGNSCQTSSVTSTSGKTELILIYWLSGSALDSVTQVQGPFPGNATSVKALSFSTPAKYNLAVFRATGNGTSAAVQVGFTNNSSLVKIDVIELSGNNTSSPIVQSPTNTGTSTTATATLSAPGSGNAELVLFGAGGNASFTTPGGFSSIDAGNGSSPNFGFRNVFNSTAQTTTSSTLSSSQPWATIALEIAHA
jgi:hypothetical protein